MIYPLKYGPSVVYEKWNKMIYLEFLKSIYIMLQSDLLSCIKLRKYLDKDGFKFNPYDPCVANKIIEWEPPTIVFRVDDVKASHKNTKMVDKFEQ